jgi:hypothetical protein
MPSASGGEDALMSFATGGVNDSRHIWQAAKLGKIQAVKDALEAETVTVSDIDHDGNTLLHMAASQGHKALVKELMRRGADPQIINFTGKRCYDMAHELNYWELGDYIREKVGIEKLGPSNKWQGEPGAPSLGGDLSDEAISKLMRHRERQKQLAHCWELLGQIDWDLVITAIADHELKAARARGRNVDGGWGEEVSNLGQRDVEEMNEGEKQAAQSIHKLRNALGDAKRAKVLCYMYKSGHSRATSADIVQSRGRPRNALSSSSRVAMCVLCLVARACRHAPHHK